ncbi:MAG: hypothetical protein H7Y01_11640, partial [Ferruginibacter sp.]|nr:hypothetical protein [Chitinophagaceae bacterium]
MTDNLKLFSTFDPVSKKQWKETAVADLKGADFEKRLVWKTDEGIVVQPFYTEEDLQNISVLSQPTPTTNRQWTNYVEVETSAQPEANKFILRMIEFGITGILLKIHEPEKIDFSILLRNIDPEKIQIAFKLHAPSPDLIGRYFTFLKTQNVHLSEIRGFVQSDVLEEWSVSGLTPDFDRLAEQLKITSGAENFRGLMLSSVAFVNAGSGIVQESAFILSKLTDTIEMLERAGLKKDQIIPELGLHMGIGGDYFFEIAKLRAIRPVLAAVLKCYTELVTYIPVLSSNSAWSKSLYDPTVNMLRNTSEAMSAILGNCDAILLNPHDSTYKSPDEFSHRIALNISNLLKEESYFDKVTDPGAGSYYIETITTGIADKTLLLFKEVEEDGGYIESFKRGLIQEKISGVKNKKEDEIATRKKVYVGTNKYVNPQEKISLNPEKVTHTIDPGFPLLPQERATQNFESLRQRSQHQFERTGKTLKVYLACFGNPAMRNIRASFSAEFFDT